MSNESVLGLQETVIEFRKVMPSLIDNFYQKQFDIKDDITFKQEDNSETVELPKVNFKSNLGTSSDIQEIIDEKMMEKMKEQLKLIKLLQKKQNCPISKMLDSLYKTVDK